MNLRSALTLAFGLAFASVSNAATESRDCDREQRPHDRDAAKTRHSCYSPFAVADVNLWAVDKHMVDEHDKSRSHDNVRATSKEQWRMADILHRVGIKSSPDEVYKALTTREGLAAWWTNNTQGEGKVGGVLKFRFSAAGSEIGGFCGYQNP